MENGLGFGHLENIKAVPKLIETAFILI